MDSQGSAELSQLQPQQAPPPPGMMVGLPPPQHSSYMPTIPTTTTNTNPVINLHSNATTTTMQNPQFPFNSTVTSASKPLDYGDGSSPSSGFGASGFSIEPARKKRGRPRKYSPAGGNNIDLSLVPNPITQISAVGYPDSSGGPTSSEPPTKRNRGRPAGSGKKQLDALGAPGVGFTPHVILVQAGEDIASKIMAFSQQGPRAVCILSANGAVCNVTLRQPAMSGGTVTYEGRFEIISLTGSFMLSESNGNHSRTAVLSVSLAGSDGRVLGGGVAGMLIAATPVQVVVGSFIADRKKSKSGLSPATLSNMLNFTAPVAGTSPSSQGASSESSDENGHSPLNHGSGPYSNASQPIQNPPVYTHMGWSNPTMNMTVNPSGY
ncbi:unnamed protein product [Ilex paraguariensis]|uniref:AT-hook motif nuclear-localized protein n=1 Tax=Ilex paraguariensis TaxID=185542 RepID=A0ABC8TWB3_9AQUA